MSAGNPCPWTVAPPEAYAAEAAKTAASKRGIITAANNLPTTMATKIITV